MTPASESFDALTMTRQRMAMLLSLGEYCLNLADDLSHFVGPNACFYPVDEPAAAKSTKRRIFLRIFIRPLGDGESFIAGPFRTGPYAFNHEDRSETDRL